MLRQCNQAADNRAVGPLLFLRRKQHCACQHLAADKLKLKVGEALPGFCFKPGECFVNSTWGEEFRQGKSTPKQFDGLTRERGERANAFLKILWKWLLSQDGNKEARGGGSSEGEAAQ